MHSKKISSVGATLSVVDVARERGACRHHSHTMTVAGDNVFWTGDDPHGSDDCDRSNRDPYSDVRVNHGVIHR